MSGAGDRASTRLSSAEGAAGGDPPSEGDPQSVVLKLWRAIMEGNETGLQDHIDRLGNMNGGSGYLFDEQGAFHSLSSVLPRGVSSAVGFWSHRMETKVMYMDPGVVCGAAMNAADGPEWFAACAKKINERFSPSACTTISHRDEGRSRITSGSVGPVYGVLIPDGVQKKVFSAACAKKINERFSPSACTTISHRDEGRSRITSGSVGPVYGVLIPDGVQKKVFSRFVIKRSDLPEQFFGSECDRVLRSITAFPYVWMNIINCMPDLEQLTAWADEAGVFDDTESVSAQTGGTDAASGASTRGLDPSSHGGEDRRSEARTGSARNPEVGAQDLRSLLQDALKQIQDLLSPSSRSTEAGRLQERVLNLETAPPRRDGGVSFARNGLSEEELERVNQRVLAGLDYGEILTQVSRHLPDSARLQDQVDEKVGAARAELEKDIQLALEQVRKSIENLEAARNSSVVSRGGMLFSSKRDVEALVNLTPADKRDHVAICCLDMMSVLYLLDARPTEYTAQIQALANVRKAGFNGVIEAQVKLSFSSPLPPAVIKEDASDKTKFRDPSNLETQLGSTVASMIEKKVEEICTSHENMVNTAFPLNPLSQDEADNKISIWNHILLEQVRKARVHAVSFLRSFIPIYKTLTGAGLPSKEAWNRVHVFAREIITAIQAKRTPAAEMASASQMVWCSFQATDLAEEFAKAEFIQHPMVSSLMCLTALQRDSKAVSDMGARVQSVSDVNTSLAGRVDVLEADVKVLKKKK
ncbi:LOW QUALITY PROTEIN: hypothetical protein ACHAWC_011806 [Mediolabrus comicus]